MDLILIGFVCKIIMIPSPIHMNPPHPSQFYGPNDVEFPYIHHPPCFVQARMAEMQSRWEERFCEAVDFWHQAWSTTTSVAPTAVGGSPGGTTPDDGPMATLVLYWLMICFLGVPKWLIICY